ncbi:MAG: uracil phosphoribosyltransferase, partial [Microvirga sp.]|nr:uracil phosphoribosyltransferase [Microvirga sp.]
AEGFQVSADNPLIGLEGRAALLNRLGRVVATNPDIFGQVDDPRPGGLFDVIAATADGERIKATAILEALLAHLGPIWPGRITLGGIDLGDTWRHPLIEAQDATKGLVPFHKLSQWLSYSLIEPLEWAGFTVVEIDGLTGLPEYRNGGLFIDTGVIALKDAADATHAHAVDSQLVVEWRALTVALLDRIADPIRARLGFAAEEFPLAKALEGGTWATGRRLAKEKRGDGSPPLSVISDGTVF